MNEFSWSSVATVYFSEWLNSSVFGIRSVVETYSAQMYRIMRSIECGHDEYGLINNLYASLLLWTMCFDSCFNVPCDGHPWCHIGIISYLKMLCHSCHPTPGFWIPMRCLDVFFELFMWQLLKNLSKEVLKHGCLKRCCYVKWCKICNSKPYNQKSIIRSRWVAVGCILGRCASKPQYSYSNYCIERHRW